MAKSDFTFQVTIGFRADNTIARRSHFLAGLICRALKLPGISHVFVRITSAKTE